MKRKKEHYHEDERASSGCMKCGKAVLVPGTQLCDKCTRDIMEKTAEPPIPPTQMVKYLVAVFIVVIIISQMVYFIRR